jgi:hypothetical protein
MSLSNDPLIYLIGVTIARTAEITFCFVVYGTYRRNFKDRGLFLHFIEQMRIVITFEFVFETDSILLFVIVSAH